MRPTALFPALLILASAAPAAAQGIVVPVRCQGACTLVLDSVDVWANLERGQAVTYVDHVIRNATADSVEGAFFFPLPRGAVVDRVWVRAGQELELYGEWTRPEESRLILDGLARARPEAGLAAYAGMDVVHVRVPAIGPRGVKHLQIAYTQPLRAEGGRIAYRYPLAVAAAPVGHLDLGMTVKTEAGFEELRSPTHAVRIEVGTEPGPCAPRERCGYKGYPSHRVRVVRLEHAADARTRDFELVYVPRQP
jgi:Vault protein inter-alpha-trypsin domain